MSAAHESERTGVIPDRCRMRGAAGPGEVAGPHRGGGRAAPVVVDAGPVGPGVLEVDAGGPLGVGLDAGAVDAGRVEDVADALSERVVADLAAPGGAGAELRERDGDVRFGPGDAHVEVDGAAEGAGGRGGEDDHRFAQAQDVHVAPFVSAARASRGSAGVALAYRLENAYTTAPPRGGSRTGASVPRRLCVAGLSPWR